MNQTTTIKQRTWPGGRTEDRRVPAPAAPSPQQPLSGQRETTSTRARAHTGPHRGCKVLSISLFSSLHVFAVCVRACAVWMARWDAQGVGGV